MEITKLHERCLADRELRAATRNGEWLIALHSSLSSAEQQSVFERPPEGARPFLLACYSVHAALPRAATLRQ